MGTRGAGIRRGRGRCRTREFPFLEESAGSLSRRHGSREGERAETRDGESEARMRGAPEPTGEEGTGLRWGRLEEPPSS